MLNIRRKEIDHRLATIPMAIKIKREKYTNM
jgi:hypothetical protein